MTAKGKKQPKKIVRRKRKTNLADLDAATKMSLIEDYQSGDLNFGELADKYNLKSPGAIEKWIKRHINQLNIVHETNKLAVTNKGRAISYRPNNLINEPFLDLLSADEDELTNEEFSYVYLLTFVGDNKLAMQESGLSVGLESFGAKDSKAYNHAVKMRGLFLRQKPNIKERYDQLRSQKLKEATKEINKEYIVNELVDLLDKLKENGDKGSLILSTIDKLGKTCGAFVERVEVQGITASSKLDQLIEMAKKEVVPTLPPPDEVWEAEEYEQ